MNQIDHKTKEEFPAWLLDENGEPIIYIEWAELPSCWPPASLPFVIGKAKV